MKIVLVVNLNKLKIFDYLLMNILKKIGLNSGGAILFKKNVNNLKISNNSFFYSRSLSGCNLFFNT